MTKSLHVQGFRSVTDSRIPAQGLLLIRGGHGEGKSTIAASIGTALTGRNRWTDKAGKGAERQISHGASAIVIDLDVADRHITRTIRSGASDIGTSAFRVDGFTGSSLIQSKALLSELGTTREAIDVACDTDPILNASPKERADIIFSALAPKITADDLMAHLHPTSATEQEEIEFILSEFFESGATFPLSADTIEKLYTFAFKARHDSKKDVEHCERELVGVTGATIDAAAIETTRQTLAALEKVRTDLSNRLAKAEAYRETRRAIDAMGEQKVSIEEFEARIEKTGIETSTAEARARETRATATGLARSLPAQPDRPEAHDSTWNTVIEIADEIDHHCTVALLKDHTIERFVTPVRENSRRLHHLAQENGAKSPVAAKEAFETASRARSAALQDFEKAEDAATEAETHASMLRGQRQKLEAALMLARKRQTLMMNLTQSQPEDQVVLKSKLDEADSRISQVRLTLAEAAAAEKHAVTRVAAQKTLKALRERISALEVIVASLQPAKRTPLLEKKAGAICRRLQTAFQTLTTDKYSLEIVFDPFEIRILKSGTAAPVTLDFLSASEQYRTAVLLQDAVASLGKSPFLVIDGADILLPEEFQALLTYLESRRHRYQAIIVTAAINELDPRINVIGQEWQNVILNPPIRNLRMAA